MYIFWNHTSAFCSSLCCLLLSLKYSKSFLMSSSFDVLSQMNPLNGSLHVHDVCNLSQRSLIPGPHHHERQVGSITEQLYFSDCQVILLSHGFLILGGLSPHFSGFLNGLCRLHQKWQTVLSLGNSRENWVIQSMEVRNQKP